MPKGVYNRGQGKGVAWLREHLTYSSDFCLLWPFDSKVRDGYGITSLDGKMYRAHRLMCEWVHGPAPTPEHEAAHSCGNGHKGCCNPRHLSWKTRAENQQDRIAMGNVREGPRYKLTAEQVAEIRALKGIETSYALAERFGVSRTNIVMVQKGETWKDGVQAVQTLTPEQVNRIRTGVVKHGDQRKIARELGISETQVFRVLKGATYQYVPPENSTQPSAKSPADE